jgi:hypothetical protein
MKASFSYDEIYGSLLNKNDDDTQRVYFIIECELWKFKCWMFIHGWSFSIQDKSYMRNELRGYEVTLIRQTLKNGVKNDG